MARKRSLMNSELSALLDAVNRKDEASGLSAGLQKSTGVVNDDLAQEFWQVCDFASQFKLEGDEIGRLWFGSKGVTYKRWIEEFGKSYPVENGFVVADSDGFIVFLKRSESTVYAAWRWTDSSDGLPIAPDFDTFLKWAAETYLHDCVPDAAMKFATSDLATWFWKELAPE